MKFSVIIPIYNAEIYLQRCLDSIFAYKGELEVLALDDGSSDGSLALLNRYSDPRLKVIHKENEGTFKTWKRGVELATGDYIVFVDSDDYVSSDLFPSLNAVLINERYDLVQFGWALVRGARHTKTEKPYPAERSGAYSGETLAAFKQKNIYIREVCELPKIPWARWGKAFRTEKLKAVLPHLMESIRMFEDDSAVIPFMLDMETLYILPKALYYYRIGRPGSVCNSPEKFEGYLRDAKAICEYFANPCFGFPSITLDCYYFHYHMDVLCHAVNAKDTRLALKILSDERFGTLLSERKEFKFRLLFKRKFRTYRFLRKIKNLLWN